MRRATAIAALVLLCAASGACRRPAGIFSEQNARAHVGMLAGTIGSRPVGSAANARAREYIVDQLRLFGLEVRVQETDARRAELGRTARVHNIIGVLPGTRREAVAVVAHYDSASDAPGATDDALGVSVALETARVAAARAGRRWSLMVLVTDGEEAGLMGAAALTTDRDVMDRLRAYLNLESIGSSGSAHLFETGPGNGWLTRPWARSTPHPRGGSYGIEIYRRLPNDTDFSIFKRYDVAGLNFAPVGDSYAYHTARDTPERLSSRTIRELGENVVAIVQALDGVDITQRTALDATYFDVGGVAALSYGPGVAWTLAAAALLLAAIAWLKVTAAALRIAGVGRWLLTLFWSVLGGILVIASMVAVSWALRAAREVYHPWYARPGRFFLLLVATGVAVGWSAGRVGRWIPARAHGVRHPVLTWSVTLPFWFALTAVALWQAPAAAYLWVLPLLTAGLTLAMAPVTNAAAVHLASAIVLGVAGTLWLHDVGELLRFVVTIFGRLPVVTPVFVYAAVMGVAGVMVVPPLIATAIAARPMVRPSLVTALCLIAAVVAAVLAYGAPAYTPEQPLRRSVRALQEADGAAAIWEVGSTEPGLDLGPGAPAGWARATTAVPASVPWGRLAHPFSFRTTGPALGPPPATIAGFTVQPVEAGHQISVSVIPREAGLALSFVLPEGVTPARSNLPGIRRGNRWMATYVAAPAQGVAFQASFGNVDPARLQDVRVLVTSGRFPGGTGWQSLPAWLPQEQTVWSGSAAWALPAAGPIPPAIEPVPPLR
jgi:hypothetical protein